MLIPQMNWELCQVCDPCQARKVCKTRAIMQIDPDEPPIIALERCNRCAACVLACCCGAVSMVNSGSSGGENSGGFGRR